MIKLRIEIVSSLLNLATSDKNVVWKDFLDDMKDHIIPDYDGQKNLKVYKGDWKSRCRAVAKSMDYKIVGLEDHAWDLLEGALSTKLPRKSGTSTTSSNYKVSENEKQRVLGICDSISPDQKWILSTGTVVDDQMRQLMNGFLYEHPVHSLILDPSDMIWNGRFSADELDEIKTHKLKPLSHLPNDLMECLDKYDKKWANALDVY